MKILFAWTGYRELNEARNRFPEYKSIIDRHIKSNGITQKLEGNSWVRNALRKGTFDKLVMLVDFSSQALRESENDFLEAYKHTFDKYECAVQIIPVILRKSGKNPELYEMNDYGVVYKKTKEILEQNITSNDKLYILLSSGTSAMTTCLVLLGKTLFDGARFLRDISGELKEFTIPFNMSIDLASHFYDKRDSFQFELPKSFNEIMGTSPKLLEAKRMASKAAIHEVNILLIGESGTGKEVFANAIHKASQRSKRKLFSRNCAMYSKEFVVSELFGYAANSFTGAGKVDHPGVFEDANQSTLFLDEIGELPIEAQNKLLRALQPPKGCSITTRCIVPFGSNKEIEVDVRLIAATNKDIELLANETNQYGINNEFRMDLLQRIGTIIIRIPPLRERREDIEPLAKKFLDDINRVYKGDVEHYTDKRFSHEAITFLVNHDWVNTNVRGLQNAVYRAAAMCDGEIIYPKDFGLQVGNASPMQNKGVESLASKEKVDLNTAISELERRYIMEALERYPHNSTAAAKWLGLKSYQTLKGKMNRLGIEHSFR